MSNASQNKLASLVQEHFVPQQAVKREWSLLFFFRILGNSETASFAAEDTPASAESDDVSDDGETDANGEFSRFAIDPQAVSFEEFAGVAAETDPPNHFIQFLRLLAVGEDPGEVERSILDAVAETLGFHPDECDEAWPDNANRFFRHGLLGVSTHEFLRYTVGAVAWAGKGPLLRVDAMANGGSTSGDKDDHHLKFSNAAVNLAFTHSGLEALKIDSDTLASFPEVFRQGMAGRARLTGDESNYPAETWDGELGQRAVQGMLTISFPVTETGLHYWDRLENDVRAFNLNKLTHDGIDIRPLINRLFFEFGMEILHIELGQVPYSVQHTSEDECDFALGDVHELGASDDSGGPQILRPEHRREHFGFRDGISQPFVDLGLKTPLPGGGTPARDGTWRPVASGEIFLGMPDEDGLVAMQPFNPDLREGGTYLVFRKLEQDVAGFRSFLAEQRDEIEDQERLAAQMVGRWPDGAPVVRHPRDDSDYSGDDAEYDLNDFRYFSEDPHGRRCPIGSHVRRTNPRDTSGRDDVKRHRILRRGMAYGGPFLPHGSLGDGRQRGLLFMCVNSRIDLQFELIQREWINGGEFLGQVGAGLCPISGTNNGQRRDEFLEADAFAPLTNLPAFLYNRGGEYFFVPSIPAILKYTLGDRFEPKTAYGGNPIPYGPYSASMAETPSLLQPKRVKAYIIEILCSIVPYKKDDGTDINSADEGNVQTMPRKVIRVRLPKTLRKFPPNPGPRATQDPNVMHTLAFVGQYRDVVMVLGGLLPEACAANGGRPPAQSNFSVAHYLQAGREITRGGDLLIAMDPGGPLSAKRIVRQNIMRNAWQAQPWTADDYEQVQSFISKRVDELERRVSQTGHMDILQDLAFDVCYGLVEKFIGLPGPDHLSELAVSLPYARRNITGIPADWLRTRPRESNYDSAFVTTQMWSRLAFGEVIGNILDRREYTSAAIQATSEMLTHIDEHIKRERLRDVDRSAEAQTVLQKLVWDAPQADQDAYFEEVRIILADLVTTISMNIALPFSKAIQAALAFRMDLEKIVPRLERLPEKDGYSYIEILAFELLRLFPSAPAIFRRCETATTLPSGAEIKKGDWVAALLPAASLDPNIFPKPQEFSLGLSGQPSRDPKDYLLFGPPCGIHRCWGEERLGRLVLKELFRAAARFPGLQTVAGPNGEVVKFAGMDFSLRAKFRPFKPD